MATQPQKAVALIPSEEGARFDLMQREARLFANSPLIPQHLRQGGETQAVANCYIALKLARTMGEDPLVVLQNIHVVNGKAGFATQYMIARANASGIFHGRIDWRIDRSDQSNLTVTAFATLKDTGQEVSVTVDMAMAKAEGWTKNPKYNSMPEVMLRYRSAAFLVRFYAPDVMLGYQTTEEVEDVTISHGPDLNAAPLSAAMLIEQAATTEEVVFDAEAEDATDNPNAPHGEQFNDTPEETERAEETIAETEDEAPYPAKVRDLRASLASARTLKAVEQIDREWCNTLRNEVEEADPGLMQSVERDIGNRRRDLRADG